jgi:hypothetical protein
LIDIIQAQLHLQFPKIWSSMTIVVMAGVPVAVAIKAAGLFEDASPILCHERRLDNRSRSVN